MIESELPCLYVDMETISKFRLARSMRCTQAFIVAEEQSKVYYYGSRTEPTLELKVSERKYRANILVGKTFTELLCSAYDHWVTWAPATG